jgi:hypothetical protein
MNDVELQSKYLENMKLKAEINHLQGRLDDEPDKHSAEYVRLTNLKREAEQRRSVLLEEIRREEEEEQRKREEAEAFDPLKEFGMPIISRVFM